MAEYRIYTRFCEGGGFAGEVIEAFSRERFSHIEFWQPNWPGEDQSFGAQVDGGLIWRKMSDACYKDLKSYEIRSIPIADEQYIKYCGLLKSLEGEKYNELGIAAFALGHILPVSNRQFCSQAWSFVMNQIGVLPLAWDPATYRPGDCAQMHLQLPGDKLETSWRKE